MQRKHDKPRLAHLKAPQASLGTTAAAQGRSGKAEGPSNENAARLRVIFSSTRCNGFTSLKPDDCLKIIERKQRLFPHWNRVYILASFWGLCCAVCQGSRVCVCVRETEGCTCILRDLRPKAGMKRRDDGSYILYAIRLLRT